MRQGYEENSGRGRNRLGYCKSLLHPSIMYSVAMLNDDADLTRPPNAIPMVIFYLY